MESTNELKSYVWHRGQCYFVSTITRDSSAPVTPAPRYPETMAWEYDWDKGERGRLVGEDGEGRDAFDQHIQMCEMLYHEGAE